MRLNFLSVDGIHRLKRHGPWLRATVPVFLTFVAGVLHSAEAPSGAGALQTYTRTTELPHVVGLQAMTEEEVARLAATSSTCGGWVFMPKTKGGDQPGTPVMAFVGFDGRASGAPSGVAKIGGTLYPVAARPVSASEHINAPVQTRFLVGPFVPVHGFEQMTSVLKAPDNYLDGIQLSLLAVDGRIAVARANCTVGPGKCRRYTARYDAQWWAFADRSSGTQKAVQLATHELIIEDRCPYTRAGMVESYASRLGLLEDFYRLINP